MTYLLSVRALLKIVRKEKAFAHAQRQFPGLTIACSGHYWKDDSLWEFTAQHAWEFPDDQAALWETLKYFGEVDAQWTIQFRPNPRYEVLIWGIAENNDGFWSWCHYELRREV